MSYATNVEGTRQSISPASPNALPTSDEVIGINSYNFQKLNMASTRSNEALHEITFKGDSVYSCKIIDKISKRINLMRSDFLYY